MLAVVVKTRSPVLAGLLCAVHAPLSSFWRVTLEGLVEAEQLAAASPADPALRDIADTLEVLFLATARRVFAGRPRRMSVLGHLRAGHAGLSWRPTFARPRGAR